MVLSRLLALVLSVVLATRASATDVGGPILSDTTWTLVGSPYVVTQSIIVGGNSTLTIEPGVTVKFNLGRAITVGHGSWGVGTLRAIGTATQKITFTTNENQAEPGQWQSILFNDLAVDATIGGAGQYLSGSTLQHCIVEYAGGGAVNTGAISILQCSPFLSHCEIHSNARSGVYASNVLSSPPVPSLRIKNCNIHHNAAGSDLRGGGVRLAVNGLDLVDNTISNNSAISPNFSSSALGGGAYLVLTASNSTFVICRNEIAHNTVTALSSNCNNVSSNGGGIYVSATGTNGAVLIERNLILHNVVTSNGCTGCCPFNAFGGGVFLSHAGTNSLVLESNHIVSNVASVLNDFGGCGGGGVFISGSASAVTLRNNNVFDNVSRHGGGLYLQSGPIMLEENTIAYNQAAGSESGDGLGGGICKFGSGACTLVSNSIIYNMARGGALGGAGSGGGLFVAGTGVSLAGNQATGAFNLVAGNSANYGDAVYNDLPDVSDGTNDIPAQFVCWGGVDPHPLVDSNLIYDNFDNAQRSYVLYPPHVSGQICAAPAGCGMGFIPDCNGNCAPVSWIGDGYCDNGFYAYNGVPIYFNCQQFGNDGGDCDAPMPPIMNPPNHDEPEAPPQYDDPTPPTLVQDKHIVIVHGWNTDRDRYENLWIPFRDAIRNHPSIGPDWKVDTYNWYEASQTGLLYPDQAAVIANLCGLRHGTAIVSQTPQVKHVHLIGHSAGSAFVAAAAYQIKRLAALESPPRTITVHTTYLDAYAPHFDLPGVGGYEEAYGGHGTDWSDHYYSREPDFDRCDPVGCLLEDYYTTGEQTQLYLPNSFNFDVSLADPDYNESDCLIYSPSLSSHGWPVRFYGFTVNGVMLEGCEPPVGAIGQYGFSLGYAPAGGSVTQWIAGVVDEYPPGGSRELPTGETAPSMALQTSMDPAMDLIETASFVSDSESVQVAGVLSMTTHPPAGEPKPAWINFQIVTTTHVNFVAFDMAFTGNPGAAGLLTMYVNGAKCGMVDEQVIDPGMQHYQLPTPGELAPGEHYLSFRLDHFNELESSVVIQNIATGFGQFVLACRTDFDGNGEVQVPDIFAFLTAWFAGDLAADFDGVDGLGVPDIFAFLTAWFEGCP